VQDSVSLVFLGAPTLRPAEDEDRARLHGPDSSHAFLELDAVRLALNLKNVPRCLRQRLGQVRGGNQVTMIESRGPEALPALRTLDFHNVEEAVIRTHQEI